MTKAVLVKKSEAQERYTKEPLPRDTRLNKTVSPVFAIGLSRERRVEVFNGLFKH